MNKLSLAITAAVATAAFGLSSVAPAKADQASTTNTILGAAAVIAGIAIESNVARKNAAASRIQGYTQSGATVYGDGRIVQPDGTTYYPGNNNQSVACSNNNCQVTNNNGYGGYNTGYNGNWQNNGNRQYNGRYNGQYNTGYNGQYNGGYNGQYNNQNRRDRDHDGH